MVVTVVTTPIFSKTNAAAGLARNAAPYSFPAPLRIASRPALSFGSLPMASIHGFANSGGESTAENYGGHPS